MNTGQIKALKNVLPRNHQGKLLLALGLVLFCLLNLLFAPVAYGAPSAQVTLPLKQTFISRGSTTPISTIFSYSLTPKDASSPLPPNRTTFSVDGSTETLLGPFDFTKVGIFNYELRCITGSGQNFIYDKEVYDIMIVVKNDMTALLIIENSAGEKVSQMNFTQIYQVFSSDPAVMVDPPVVKTVTGTPLQKGTFLFRLKAENISNPMPEGSSQGAKTIQIIGAGQKDFGTWSYHFDGVYRYTVFEINRGEPGYTYDAELYTITDEVKDIGGRLIVSRSVTDRAGKEVSLPLSMPFVNNYSGIRSGLPRTGDFRNPLFLIAVLLFVSWLLFLFLLWRRDRKRDQAQAAE